MIMVGVHMKVDMFVELVAFQSEGIDTLLDNLEKNHIKEITIEPRFFIETGNPSDLRLPPLDLDGSNRKLERPLFGGNDVKYGKKYFCFIPDEHLFSSTVYRPDCKSFNIDFCKEVVLRAKARGFRINIFVPPVPKGGYDEKDYDVTVDGRKVLPAISKEACRNSEDVINYYVALANNLIKEYNPDGLMFDWIEYTNYAFSDNFLCFCGNCTGKMEEYGYSVEHLRSIVLSVYDWVRNVDHLPSFDGMDAHDIWKSINPDIHEFFKFKQESIYNTIIYIRNRIEKTVELLFTGFAPPMNKATGLLPVFSDAGLNIRVQPKMYRFHWAMMVNWYASELYSLNSGVPLSDWICFVKKLLEVTDPSCDIRHYVMPSPGEVGALDIDDERMKMKCSFEKDSNCLQTVRLHGYATDEEFEQRVSFAKAFSYERVSIQRYGYLSDEKIAMLDAGE